MLQDSTRKASCVRTYIQLQLQDRTRKASCVRTYTEINN